MKFKIHRGTKEIGGSCVEVWTASTRILLDFGMPLVDEHGDDFNFCPYKELTQQELIREGILHNIEGLYPDSDNLIDGIVISHAHQDHVGLLGYAHPNIKCYLGEATHEIIKLSNIFNRKDIELKNTFHFEKSTTFTVGDISITPYWNDHSGFDAYSFLIEANGKSIFYSGDFRSHGRKAKAFEWFTHNAPKYVDYLLLEGTTIGGLDEPFKTETDIENELIHLFEQPGKTNLIYSSGQNIDRLVSIYRACLKTEKIMVVDVYVASVLKTLSPFAKIPFPSKEYKNLKVLFPKNLCNRLKRAGNEKYFYQFKHHKITKEEIIKQPDNVVMIVRSSLQPELEYIHNLDGGNIIYSMWEGYLEKEYTKKFIAYLESRHFTMHQIHTSGHADTPTLKRMVAAIEPKHIVPIHTFEGDNYKDIFDYPVVRLQDGEMCVV